MKSKWLALLVIVFIIASFIVPSKLALPAPASADPGLMEWTIVDTPDSEPGLTKALYSPEIPSNGGFTMPQGSELIKLVIGSNGSTMYVLARIRGNHGFPPTAAAPQNTIILLKSVDGGVTWSHAKHMALVNYTGISAINLVVWDIAIAPDNPNLIFAAVASKAVGVGITQQVWASQDGGDNWDNTQWPPATGGIVAGTAIISAMDITNDISGYRKVLIATRNTTALTNNISVMKMPGFGGWNVQNAAGAPLSLQPFAGDVLTAKFSPNFGSDSTIVVVMSNAVGTYLVTGVHDIAQNFTTWQSASQYVEIKNSTSPPGQSPTNLEIITACLQLPSDFSGQSASLRRSYVSTDAADRTSPANGLPNRGVFRIDDTIVYTLMDTSITFNVASANVLTKRVASIAYWGTYASGKLLVGERLGHSCTASVPVWFTDSPTVCPVPCWYPAKKPPTGAAGMAVCDLNTQYFGNAQVAWSPTYADKGVAYAITGASALDPRVNGAPPPPYLSAFNLPIAGDWTAAEGTATRGWPSGLLNYQIFDESAFSLTRNNGETWNQLSLIDTNIAKLTDVAPSPDCTTMYLASTNNGTACKGFDSVWRTSTNEAVVSPPLPALPIGQIWERVRTSPTALTCSDTQSNYAILRLTPEKVDGAVVFWAAGGTSLQTSISADYDAGFLLRPFPVGVNTRAAAWSPDFGDYWSDLNPRIPIQDMAAESATALYVIDTEGNVQKMPYGGTAWTNSVNTVGSQLAGSHTVDAQADGKVLVSNRSGSGTPFPASVSTNGGQTFTPNTRVFPEGINYIGLHGIFDTDYKTNETIYVANDSPVTTTVTTVGLIYRNKMPSGANIAWDDIITGYTTHYGYFGIVQTNSKNASLQGTLYAAHRPQGAFTVGTGWVGNCFSGVERNLLPLSGVPKPGMDWDCLDASVNFFQTNCPSFTLEPESLKLCGCLTQDTYTTLYAIDNKWYAGNHSAYAGQGISPGTLPYAVRSRGMLWAYTDCMAKKGPKLTMDDGTIIGCDPVTGRAQEVNFTWEQLCIANAYELWVGKDKPFTQQVHQSNIFYLVQPVLMSPTYIYFTSTGSSLLNISGTHPCLVTGTNPTGAWTGGQQMPLECGHLYYWKVRVRDETTCDSVRSPWSETRAFTIKAGFRVTTPYYGPQLLAPDNGCGCVCGAPIIFSWSPFKETQEYKFELSASPDMSSPLVSTNVKTTAYQYTGTAKCNSSYFWRVRADKPAPSEWSAVFSFLTQKEAPPPPAAPKAPETPIWVWVLITIGAVLVIITLVLIFITRRT